MSSSNAPCAACKLQRRKCTPDCVFAPHFPADQPQKFSYIHKVFGASNVAKLLNELDISQREDAVSSLAYEAEMRLRDPVYGCVGPISALNQKLTMLQLELYNAKKELSTYIGPQAMLPMIQPQQAAAFHPSGLPTAQYMGGHRAMAGPSGLGGVQTMAGHSEQGGSQTIASRSRLLGRGRFMAGPSRQGGFHAIPGPSGLGHGGHTIAGPSGLGHGGHTMTAPSQLGGGGQMMAGPSGLAGGSQMMAGPSGLGGGSQVMAGPSGLGGGDGQTMAGSSGPVMIRDQAAEQQEQIFEAQQLAMAAAAREQQELYRRYQEMNMSGGFHDTVAAGGSGYAGQGDEGQFLRGPFEGEFDGQFEGQYEEQQFHQIQGADNPDPHHHLQAHHLSLQPYQQQEQQPLMIQDEQQDQMRAGSDEEKNNAGPSS